MRQPGPPPETDAKVYIIDSETATQGEAIIAREAIRLREQGLSASRIAAEPGDL